MKAGNSFRLRIGASFLIIGSGVAHLSLATNSVGAGRASLLIFGLIYLITGGMILRRFYVTGIIAPFVGLLIGLLIFRLSMENLVFILIELCVIVLSAYLGYQVQETSGLKEVLGAC